LLKRVVGAVKAVDGVSFYIKKGETLGLVGESGCGKTTTGRLVLRAMAPTSGEIWFDDRDQGRVNVAITEGNALKRLRRNMQMIFQDPYSSLNPRMTLLETVGEPLLVHGVARGAQLRERVAELLRVVGLRPEYMSRYPHAFSGGQRQRIGIARALALNPQLIVCDEPVSALDVSIQAQVLNLMMDLQQEMGIAYLFISHNLQVVRHIADAIAVMYLGKIVEYGPKADVFARPAHPYTRSLLASTPKLRRDPSRTGSAVPGAAIDPSRERAAIRGEPPSPLSQLPGCAFHKRCPYAIERCRVEVPPLEPLGEVLVACHRAAEITRP
jgi:oligopeptide/dipeptide ABC transporter ATP-binding protein